MSGTFDKLKIRRDKLSTDHKTCFPIKTFTPPTDGRESEIGDAVRERERHLGTL